MNLKEIFQEERERLRKYTEQTKESIDWVENNLETSPCNLNPLIKRMMLKIKELEERIKELEKGGTP